MNSTIFPKRNYLKNVGIVTVISFMALMVLLGLYPSISSSKIEELEAPDQQAWRFIVPRIEEFYRMSQTSPEKVKEQVWPLISMLKNFIKTYPKSKKVPEAYYILGEAYSAASYWPEAEAHWKIVTRYFPDSQWTNQALNALVLFYERTGNQLKLKRFYKEIVRQFPDSIAAKTVKVLMARRVLEKGRVDLARKVAKKISQSSPHAEVEVPELLDLKARLALIDGKPKKAISLWIRYLNLVRYPSARSATLFNIAETYRKMGQYLKARKYYALIRKDFANQPEYLFAKFRMFQLEEEAKKRLLKYTKGKIRRSDYLISEKIFKQILERFPYHPITREVKKEFVAVEISKGDYLKALELAKKFVEIDPDNPYTKDIKKLAKKAKDLLLKKRYSVDELKRIVDFGKHFLGTRPLNEIDAYIQTVTQKKWVEYMEALLKENMPQDVLTQYWQYREFFKDHENLMEKPYVMARKAIEMADDQFLKQGKPVDLVNYYYFNKKEIDSLKNPYHFYCLAKALGNMNLSEAALRAYFASWTLGADENIKDLRCRVLSNWAGEIFEANIPKMAEDVFPLLNVYCPEVSMKPDILFLKARLALWQGDYIAAFNMAKDSMSENPNGEKAALAIRCAILLAKWDDVKELFKKYAEAIPVNTRIILLKKWGDDALMLAEYKEALYAYRLLKKSIEGDESADFRQLMAETKLLGANKTLEQWQNLAKKAKGLWRKAAKAEADYYKFSGGI